MTKTPASIVVGVGIKLLANAGLAVQSQHLTVMRQYVSCLVVVAGV